MMRNLTLVLFLMLGFLSGYAQVYEDFEGGAKLPWSAINGASYEGGIANPSKDAVNNSDFVGKLSNNDQSDFCF
ncbi:MAG TPA: hypothetical protein PKA12_11380, partial [Saprospiraceae bacterium]|nr:hypothetical protein [Saprospiraceae bacterium]